MQQERSFFITNIGLLVDKVFLDVFFSCLIEVQCKNQNANTNAVLLSGKLRGILQ
jgi:hypothetical protein